MAKKSQFDASASLLGYLYQVRYGLYLALKKLPEVDDPEQYHISIEKLGDIGFDKEGTATELLQTKISVNYSDTGGLEELKQWCDDNLTKTAKDSVIGKAIRYTINQWDSLTRYIEDGNIQIDNNAAERHIKPFVIGRKNWLFNQTPRGANASALLYSLVQTAVANNLEPFDYLKYLLTELPRLGRHYESEALDQFLPWNLVGKIKPSSRSDQAF